MNWLKRWWKQLRCPHCCWGVVKHRSTCIHGEDKSWNQMECLECGQEPEWHPW